MNKDWEIVDEQINRSKIKRIDWKRWLGMTLTEAILKLKKEGLTSEETKKVIIEFSPIADIINNSTNKGELIQKINISVSARYGESETENKILHGGE